MKKLDINKADMNIPEISPNAKARRPRHLPTANARMPRKKVALELDADILAWFESEARRGDLSRNDHINEALREYIIDLIGDKPQSPSLNKQQRNEVQRLINETLARKGFAHHVAA
jgi:uncharacterized protein (DUF4415 family)